MGSLHTDSFQKGSSAQQWTRLKAIGELERYKISFEVEGVAVDCSLKLSPREITERETSEKHKVLECFFSVKPSLEESLRDKNLARFLPARIFVQILPEIMTLIDLYFKDHPGVKSRFDLCINAEGVFDGNYSNERLIGVGGKYVTENPEEIISDIKETFSEEEFFELSIIREDTSFDSTSFNIREALKGINEEELTEHTISRAVALCFVHFAMQFDETSVGELLNNYSAWIEGEDASSLPIELVEGSIAGALRAIRNKLAPGRSSPHIEQVKVLDDISKRLNGTESATFSVGECLFVAHCLVRICASLGSQLSEDEDIAKISILEDSIQDLSLVKLFNESLGLPPRNYANIQEIASVQWKQLSSLSSGAYQILVSLCDFGSLVLEYENQFPSNKVYRSMRSRFLDEQAKTYASDSSQSLPQQLGYGWAKPLTNLVGAALFKTDPTSTARTPKVVVISEVFEDESIIRFLNNLKSTPLKGHVSNIEEKVGEIRQGKKK